MRFPGLDPRDLGPFGRDMSRAMSPLCALLRYFFACFASTKTFS
jgi:hypothetical protein